MMHNPYQAVNTTDPNTDMRKGKEEKGNTQNESRKIIIAEIEEFLKTIKKKKRIDFLNIFTIWHPYFI